MTRSCRWAALAGLVLLLAALAAHAEGVLDKPVMGTPKLLSIDVISFASDGVLLIGDGRGAQVVAVETGDTKLQTWKAAAIEKIDEKLAGPLGTTAKGIEILHLAVNPASGTAYIAVRRQDNKKNLILTVDGTGKVGEFALANVKHVAVPLPKGEKAAPSKITDVAWAGDRVLVAAQANEEFACKVYTLAAPLQGKGKVGVFSTETYHVSHRAWETKAPMSSLLPFEDKGKKYVVGAFACTPVVKYPLEELAPNARVKGRSVIELGSGNRPLHMFAYEKGGKSYVLMNTFRFHHAQRPFGPSPYWTVRIEMDLLAEDANINEKALQRLKGGKPDTDRIQMIETYHGVMHLDKLDKERALVIRQDDKTGLTLTALPLP
jgi:hypothetical protein